MEGIIHVDQFISRPQRICLGYSSICVLAGVQLDVHQNEFNFIIRQLYYSSPFNVCDIPIKRYPKAHNVFCF